LIFGFQFRTCAIKIVSFQIKSTPYTFGVFICTVITVRLEDTVYNIFLGIGNWSGLVVVVHEIIASSFSQSLLTSVNNDNWQGLHPNATEAVPLPDGGEKALQSSNEFTISEDASEFTQSAKEAYESVLKYAGC